MIKDLQKQIEEAKKQMAERLREKICTLLNEEKEVVSVFLNSDLSTIGVFLKKEKKVENGIRVTTYKFTVGVTENEENQMKEVLAFSASGKTLLISDSQIVGTVTDEVVTDFSTINAVFSNIKQFKDEELLEETPELPAN